MNDNPNVAWFVVKTNPRCEERALRGLTAAGFEVHLPRGVKLVRRRHLKRREPRSFPLLTGYLFAEVRAGGPAFYDLRGVDGVHSVLGVCGAPRPLPAGIVEEFRRLEADGRFAEIDPDAKVSVSRDLAKGDEVTVSDGPLRGLRLVFDDYFGRHSAKVVVELFGRSNVAEVDIAKLAKVA